MFGFLNALVPKITSFICKSGSMSVTPTTSMSFSYGSFSISVTGVLGVIAVVLVAAIVMAGICYCVKTYCETLKTIGEKCE